VYEKELWTAQKHMQECLYNTVNTQEGLKDHICLHHNVELLVFKDFTIFHQCILSLTIYMCYNYQVP
jgi:hypothetical protein